MSKTKQNKTKQILIKGSILVKLEGANSSTFLLNRISPLAHNLIMNWSQTFTKQQNQLTTTKTKIIQIKKI